MKKSVPIIDVIQSTSAFVVHDGAFKYVKWVVASGLMSDVLTTEKEEILLVTSLSTPQVVRTADMVGAHAILICCGKPMGEDTAMMARSLDITLLKCNKPVFEVCCDLRNLFFNE